MTMKKQVSDCAKISAKHIADEEFVSRKYKELLQLCSKRQVNKKEQTVLIDISPKTINGWQIS